MTDVSRGVDHPVNATEIRAAPFRSLTDALYATRDRLLASPRFQRWAVRFPFTRPIARGNARALFDLCAGFVYSQVLFGCIEVGLFEHLAAGPLPVEALAPRLRLSVDATTRLVDAAVSLGLVVRRGRRGYGLGLLGAALRGNPGIAAMVDHHAMLYRDLADPVALLRGEAPKTALSGYWPYAGHARPADLGGSAVSPYTALMAASQAMIADEVLDAYPFARHARLLDVGGGSGAFLAAVAARYPTLDLVLFDLPAVAEQARMRFGAAGLGGRTVVHAGDFHRDPLPTGADIVSLVRVIHDHDDDAALRLLRAVHAALPTGGTVLVAEPMAGTRGAEPAGDAYFGFYLLAMGRGRPRTAKHLGALLAAAGFTSVEAWPTCTPLLTRVLVARSARVSRL